MTKGDVTCVTMCDKQQKFRCWLVTSLICNESTQGVINDTHAPAVGGTTVHSFSGTIASIEADLLNNTSTVHANLLNSSTIWTVRTLPDTNLLEAQRPPANAYCMPESGHLVGEGISNWFCFECGQLYRGAGVPNPWAKGCSGVAPGWPGSKQVVHHACSSLSVPAHTWSQTMRLSQSLTATYLRPEATSQCILGPLLWTKAGGGGCDIFHNCGAGPSRGARGWRGQKKLCIMPAARPVTNRPPYMVSVPDTPWIFGGRGAGFDQNSGLFCIVTVIVILSP